MNDDVFIGNLLYRLRVRDGLTQKEVAKKINVSPSTIQKWEKGIRKISPAYYGLLADIFGITKEAFLYAEQYQESFPDCNQDSSDNTLSPPRTFSCQKIRPLFSFMLPCLLLLFLSITLSFSARKQPDYTLLKQVILFTPETSTTTGEYGIFCPLCNTTEQYNIYVHNQTGNDNIANKTHPTNCSTICQTLYQNTHLEHPTKMPDECTIIVCPQNQ